jgi:hypothetical protein
MKEFLKKLFLEILINAIIIICIYYLWNWLMTDLLSAKKISIFESWGLRALVQFLTYNIDYERNK